MFSKQFAHKFWVNKKTKTASVNLKKFYWEGRDAAKFNYLPSALHLPKSPSPPYFAVGTPLPPSFLPPPFIFL